MPSVSGEQTSDQNEIQTENGQQNGPTTNEQNSWKRAWNISELRENATVWSLAADAGLLKYLQQFSSELTKKAHESTLGVNKLLHDTHMADAKLRNVTDRFLTLSDSQFIENRVYDEDVSKKTNEGSENGTKETDSQQTNPEVNSVPKFSEAIQFGLKVLDEAFDILDANAANSDIDSDQYSDSDNEETANGMPPSNQGIYEPKDPYLARPLPHLIGSRGFHELDDVGVADLPSDDEIQDDHGSISESDEEVEEANVQSDSSVTSSDYDTDVDSIDSDQSHEVKRKSTHSSNRRSTISSGSQDDENLFGSGSDESDDDVSSASLPKAAAKKRSSSKGKLHKKENKLIVKKEQDVFNDEEQEEDLFAASGGLFGAGSNLFKKKSGGLFEEIDDIESASNDSQSKEEDNDSQKLSSDDEDVKTSQEKIPGKMAKKTYGGVSLFGGAVGKDFFGKGEKGDENETVSQTSGQSGKRKLDLFDSDEDEDDLFSEKPPPLTKPKASSTVSSGSSRTKPKSVFDSSSNESDKEESGPTVAKSAIKVPPKHVSKKSDLFASDSDEDDLFVDSSSKMPDVKDKQKDDKPKPPVGGVSMFGGGKQGKSLIDDLKKRNLDKTGDHTSEAAPAESESSSDEDSMFTSKPPPLTTSSKKTPGAKTSDLFDDDSDDDFFASPKPKLNATPKEPQKKTSMFDESDSDDMFSSITATKPKAKSESLSKTKVKSILDDDEEEDLFSSKAKDSDKSPIGLFSVEDKPLENLKTEARPDEEGSSEDEPPPKKKPVGAVPMFMGSVGGAELTAAISKRRSDSQISEKSVGSISNKSEKTKVEVADEPLTKSAISESNKDEGHKPISVSIRNVTAKPFKPPVIQQKTTVETHDTPTMRLHAEKSVSRLSARLSIDPTTLLPGAAPKPTPVVQAEISFDKPPSANTLESVTKTRSRGQANRRPPSRHGRGRQPQTKTPSGQESVKPVMETPSLPTEPNDNETLASSKDMEEKIPARSVAKPTIDTLFDITPAASQHEQDLFSVPEKNTKIKAASKTTTDFDDIDAELFSGSLFQKTTKIKSTEESKVKLFDSDILGDTDDKIPQKDSKDPTLQIFDEEEDASEDIFGELKIKSKVKSAAKSTKVNDVEDIFGEELDFSLPSETGKRKKKLAESKEKRKDNQKKVSADDIFGDDDDLFGSDIVVTTKSSKPKSKANKKDILFGEDDGNDIFSGAHKVDTSVTSSKKKVVKKPETKSSKTASIFEDDDIGDIFKSTKSKKVTSKASVQKKKAKKPKPEEDTANIFDDPLSLP